MEPVDGGLGRWRSWWRSSWSSVADRRAPATRPPRLHLGRWRRRKTGHDTINWVGRVEVRPGTSSASPASGPRPRSHASLPRSATVTARGSAGSWSRTSSLLISGLARAVAEHERRRSDAGSLGGTGTISRAALFASPNTGSVLTSRGRVNGHMVVRGPPFVVTNGPGSGRLPGRRGGRRQPQLAVEHRGSRPSWGTTTTIRGRRHARAERRRRLLPGGAVAGQPSAADQQRLLQDRPAARHQHRRSRLRPARTGRMCRLLCHPRLRPGGPSCSRGRSSRASAWHRPMRGPRPVDVSADPGPRRRHDERQAVGPVANSPATVVQVQERRRRRRHRLPRVGNEVFAHADSSTADPAQPRDDHAALLAGRRDGHAARARSRSGTSATRQ